jgi:hypothetical protein
MTQILTLSGVWLEGGARLTNEEEVSRSGLMTGLSMQRSHHGPAAMPAIVENLLGKEDTRQFVQMMTSLSLGLLELYGISVESLNGQNIQNGFSLMAVKLGQFQQEVL